MPKNLTSDCPEVKCLNNAMTLLKMYSGRVLNAKEWSDLIEQCNKLHLYYKDTDATPLAGHLALGVMEYFEALAKKEGWPG